MSTLPEIEWGASREMNELEATMWRAERHPQNSVQGGILRVFSATPSWDAIMQSHLRAISRLPKFRMRVVEPLLPVGTPVWTEVDDFDLAYHVRRVRLPEPGTHEQLLELAQTLGQTHLDRTRPLWCTTFIEGLEGGRAAHFTTIHHCLMDGHASIQLLSRLHAGPKDEVDGLPAPAGDPAPTPLGLVRSQSIDRVKSLPGLGVRALGGMAGVLRRDPAESLRFAASVGRVLAPPAANSSALLDKGSRSQWRYLTLECGLDELKEAGKAVGGTLNDAYVAAELGGLRRVHERLGVPLGDLTINMPVSVRRPDDAEGGNRFATAFLNVPAAVADPALRIAKLREAVSAIRAEPALDFFSILLPALNRIPAAVLTPIFIGMQTRADLTISNVPGFREPVTFSGSAVEQMFYFGPLPGSPVMSVLCSYAGRCYIGITYDGQVFEDGALLRTCMQEGLDEVLTLRTQPARSPAHA